MSIPLELCRASQDELQESLPGDELIGTPKKSVTHAVTIYAPAEAVWPWLVQLGSGRAGWYSFDRIDNGGMPSAKTVIPELQRIVVGDLVPAIPGTKDAFIVREVIPERALVLVVPIQAAAADADRKRRMAGPLRVSWSLVLKSVGPDSSRLISRGRIATDWLAPQPGSPAASETPIFIERVYGVLASLPLDLILPVAMAGHYLMESRMLRGIKARAEALAARS